MFSASSNMSVNCSELNFSVLLPVIAKRNAQHSSVNSSFCLLPKGYISSFDLSILCILADLGGEHWNSIALT